MWQGSTPYVGVRIITCLATDVPLAESIPCFENMLASSRKNR
jgi:hypothetical protein